MTNAPRRPRTSPRPRAWLADYPEILAQLHPEKNRGLGFIPRELRFRSNRVLWWRCSAGPDHEWQDSVGNRTKGRGCPFCSAHRVSVTNALASVAPAVARQWHPTQNGALTPRDVTAGSNRRVWWKCPRGDEHVWQSTVNHRALRGQGCPFCSCHRVSLETALSTLAPAIAAQWHPKKNGALTPADVTSGSSRSVWWRCPVDRKHEWKALVHDRTSQGQGCPFCSGKRVLPSTSLAARFPELAAEWHPTKNGTLLPSQVAPCAGRKVWWRCPRGPDHEWEAAIYSRKDSGGCPFCANKRVSVTNALALQYPKVARQWHPTKNSARTPDAVVATSTKYAWWRCAFGHEWRTRIYTRTSLGYGCPHCRRRLQAVVAKRKIKEVVRLSSYGGERSRKA